MTSRSAERAALALAARLLAAAAVLIVAAIPVALVLLRVLRHGRLAGLDGRVARALSAFASRSSRGADAALLVTDLGHPVVLAALVVAVTAALLGVRRRADAVFLVTTTVLGVAVAAILKAVVARASSAFVDDYAGGLDKSFPSGHAMGSACVYGALLLIALPALRPGARWVAVICTAGVVAGVCASRVALGLHYISDVVGGAVFGMAWLAASAWAFSQWRNQAGRLSARQEVPVSE